MPDSELHRVAVLTDAPPAPAEYDARMVGEPAGSYVAKVFNRRDVQQASIPGSGGIMSARGLARHYAMLANWGTLDGVRVLPEARIRAGIELQSYEWDEIYWIRARRALGYRRGRDTGPLASEAAFGHVGGGGSFGYADPDTAARHRVHEELLQLRDGWCGEPGPAAPCGVQCRRRSRLRRPWAPTVGESAYACHRSIVNQELRASSAR